MRRALCFDDVLLVPKYFDGISRSEIDTSTKVAGLDLKIPLIAANMPSVCEEDMCIALGNLGGLGILHRLCSIEKQIEMVKNVKKQNVLVGASIGIQNDAIENAEKLIGAGANLICLDVAFFAQKRAHQVANAFLEKFPTFPFVVGNIATKEHIQEFYNKTITYKVGIGSGSSCLTRIASGAGMPTLASLFDINATNVCIISDGGHKNSGDCVKSLAAKASAIMLGSMFAGTDESPGEIIELDGKKYKKYYGNASGDGKKNAGIKVDHIEGDSFMIPYKGSLKDVVNSLIEGIQSGMSYCGAKNLKELRQYAEFVEISNSGYIEGTAHGKNKS